MTAAALPGDALLQPEELRKRIEQMTEGREAIVKLHVLGRDADRAGVMKDAGPDGIMESNALPTVDDVEKRFANAGALEPPYNPSTLTALVEHSSALRPNVDAYVTNIDGFGHRFEPIIDLDAPDARLRVARVIELEREAALADPTVTAEQAATLVTMVDPNGDEVTARMQEMAESMRAEKARVEQFFNFCCEDLSFVALRRRLRQDLEVIGNGYLEVLRNGLGEVAEFTYLPAFTMRLMPQDTSPTEVTLKVKATEVTYVKKPKRKKFRRFVQVFEQSTVFFKEYGDPRVISSKTGKVYESVDVLKAAEEGVSPATEVLHFKVHSPRSSYGVPRWIGVLLAVLGSRQAEEVNYLYFENKSVPPLACLVSGGRMTEESVKRLESYIETEIKGKKNFHKMLIIEAVSDGAANALTGAAAQAKVELKPLTEAQNKDGLFMDYDERNTDKVGMAFRMPRLLRGDIRDFNRATAEAALEFAEQQVFSPEREDFDFLINRKLFSDLGIRYWKFVSNAPSMTDPQQLATIIQLLADASVITPEEARQIAEKVFNKELKTLDAAWVKQPVQLTLAGIPVEENGELRGPWVGGEADELVPDDAAAQSILTPTAMGNVVTVNEARAAAGLGPKLLPDGSPDPTGEMTVSQYMYSGGFGGFPPPAGGLPPTAGMAGAIAARHPYATAAQPVATPKSDDGGPNLGANNVPDVGGTLAGADLAQAGGLQPAQGKRPKFRRLRPSLADKARALLQVRNALLAEESKQARAEFMAAKRAEMSPEARVRAAKSLLADPGVLAAISDDEPRG